MSAKPMDTSERNADYSLLSVAKLFEPIDPEFIVGTCANIRSQIEPSDDWDNDFCMTVSAPYVLARLCALFKGLQIDVGGQNNYKTTWDTALKHVESGHIITFYDYKGGISYGSDVYGKDVSPSFIRDVRELLNVLKNDRCPHPYDGCVVGEIA